MSESDIKQSAPRLPKKRPFLKIGFWLVVIYAITGFLILPPIVRNQAQKRLTKLLNRRVTIGKVSLNPFSLSATIRDFRIREPKVGTNSVTFVSWDEVYVNLQLSSIWRQALVLHEVRIVKPYIHAQVNKDDSLNFSDLITKFSKTNAVAASSNPGKPLAVRIHRLRIIGAAADCVDLTPSRPFTRRVGPLDLSLDNFRTDSDNTNSYSFAGVTDAGEKFAGKGYFSLNPIRSQGKILLENLALSKYAPLYQDFTKFEIRDGYIGVHGEYDVELSEGGRALSVTNVTFNMKSLKVAEKGGVSNVVELSRFIISGASVDAVHHTAEVQSVAGYGGRTVLKRDQNAAINVVELTKPPANAGGVPGGILLLLQSVTNAVQMLLDSTNQWRGTIHSVNLWDGATTWEDLANPRPTALTVDHMELSATNISNLPGTNLTASMSLRWNTNGTVRADLLASFLPPTVDAHVKLDQIDLHPVDPYLESKVNVIILQSQMGMNATIKLRTVSNQLPEVSFAGDVRLDNLSTIDGVLGEDLLGWKSFRLSGIDANLNPPAVAIREVALDGAITRVVVETNRTVNLLAALNLGPLGAEPEAEAAVTNHAGSVPGAPAAPTALPKITIGTVVISNAQALLIDRSIRPNTRLTLDDVNGTISNLSSEDAQHADVNIHANVFGGAPVEIVGTINPLSQGKDTDLKIGLKGMDLTPASPYSGKFAGYRIAKGKLDLDLNYHIASRQLAASNIIVLDQFTFGEKVESTNATKLPVKLAIAILKDRDGKILLDVPIGGSLDSPDFKLGKVISRAIYNIIVKIATSPFSVLGALFGGGGDEMGYQTFAPGSSVMATNETVKLDNLIKGLYARPGLEVTVEGSVDPAADRDGLRQEKLDAQLRLMKWQSLRKASQATAKPEEMVVAPDERADFIGKLYRQIMETNAIVAGTNAIAATAKSKTKAASTQFQQADLRKGVVKTLQGSDTAKVVTATAPGTATASAAAGFEDVVAQSFAVTDDELTALANARAQAVKAYILQSGQVGPERVFLTESQSGGVRQDGSKTVLQLQ